jgi:predicted transcriptional regulator
MNDNVKIPRALVKRINRVTAQVGVTPSALVKAALANQLDYEEWFLKAVDEGIADLDAGRTFSTREVLAAIAKQRDERAARKRKQAA